MDIQFVLFVTQSLFVSICEKLLMIIGVFTHLHEHALRTSLHNITWRDQSFRNYLSSNVPTKLNNTIRKAETNLNSSLKAYSKSIFSYLKFQFFLYRTKFKRFTTLINIHNHFFRRIPAVYNQFLINFVKNVVIITNYTYRYIDIFL